MKNYLKPEIEFFLRTRIMNDIWNLTYSLEDQGVVNIEEIKNIGKEIMKCADRLRDYKIEMEGPTSDLDKIIEDNVKRIKHLEIRYLNYSLRYLGCTRDILKESNRNLRWELLDEFKNMDFRPCWGLDPITDEIEIVENLQGEDLWIKYGKDLLLVDNFNIKTKILNRRDNTKKSCMERELLIYTDFPIHKITNFLNILETSIVWVNGQSLGMSKDYIYDDRGDLPNYKKRVEFLYKTKSGAEIILGFYYDFPSLSNLICPLRLLELKDLVNNAISNLYVNAMSMINIEEIHNDLDNMLLKNSRKNEVTDEMMAYRDKHVEELNKLLNKKVGGIKWI